MIMLAKDSARASAARAMMRSGPARAHHADLLAAAAKSRRLGHVWAARHALAGARKWRMACSPRFLAQRMGPFAGAFGDSDWSHDYTVERFEVTGGKGPAVWVLHGETSESDGGECPGWIDSVHATEEGAEVARLLARLHAVLDCGATCYGEHPTQELQEHTCQTGRCAECNALRRVLGIDQGVRA